MPRAFDGFAAAWVARRYYGNHVEFYEGVYGQPPPLVAGRKVLLVDFSYPRPVIEQLARDAESVTIFDHHKTAREALESLDLPNVTTVFDMTRSGAGITWDVLFEGKYRPQLLNHIEDRDLWRFALENTRLVHAALESYPRDFIMWDYLMVHNIEALVTEGRRLDALHWQHINMLVPLTSRPMRIAGFIVSVANLPITLCSDAGMKMSEQQPFAATYMDTPAGRQFSLRSDEDGLDVSKIAERLGRQFGTNGGGHPHAAGFLAPRNWEGEELFPLLPREKTAEGLRQEELSDEAVVVRPENG
jgi:oligoribonuclease NrnB/cAMP/cGMP phosphodiesterase (DHH superfamily)